MKWIIFVILFVFMKSGNAWGQAAPVGTRISPEIPAVPAEGPFSQTGKVAPSPVSDLGARQKVVVVYHVARDQDFVADYQERINTATAFINSFFADAALYHSSKRGETGDRSQAGLSFLMDDRDTKNVAVLTVHGERVVDGYWTRGNKFDYVAIVKETLATFRQATNGAEPRQFVFLIFSDAAINPERKNKDTSHLGGEYQGVAIALISGKTIRPDYCASTIEEQLSFFPSRRNITGGRFVSGAHEIGHALGRLPHDTDRIMINGRLVTVAPRFSVMSVVSEGCTQNFLSEKDEPKVRFADDEITKLVATGALSSRILRVSKR